MLPDSEEEPVGGLLEQIQMPAESDAICKKDRIRMNFMLCFCNFVA